MVVNLAAQAGVRYSLENPNAYVDSNLVGVCKYPGRVSAFRGGAPGVCVFLVGIRHERKAAVSVLKIG